MKCLGNKDDLIIKEIISIIVANTGTKILADDINMETSFDVLNLNSITFIKIIVNLESEFDFEFDDEMLVITAFPTIGSMVDYVKSKIK